MKRIVRLTESDLTRIVRRVISEQEQMKCGDYATVYGKFLKRAGDHIRNDISPKAISFTDVNGKEGYFYCYRVGGDPRNPNESKQFGTFAQHEFTDGDNRKVDQSKYDPCMKWVLERTCVQTKKYERI